MAKKIKAKKPAPKTKASTKPAKKVAPQPVAKKNATQKPMAKKTLTEPKMKNTKLSNEQRIKSALKKLAGGTKDTPPPFKIPSRRNTPVAFSLNDVRDLLKDKGRKGSDDKKATIAPLPRKSSPVATLEAPAAKPRTLKSATLDDLLGLGGKKAATQTRSEADVAPKYLPAYKKLVALRERVAKANEERSEQTLKASAKESSGDLSSYGQHTADAGTDAFDYDFALSLVSSDNEMLREIDAAIERIFAGTYGICEVTGKPISRDRLNAVPFTRFSREGQEEYERNRRRTAQRIGISSSEEDDDTAAATTDDENEES